MTTFFVARHKGAVDWARRRGIEARHVTHLDPETIKPGDTVLGTLPVSVAAQVCANGGRYVHLTLDTPPEHRGRELTADDMDAFGAVLEEYDVRKVNGFL